MAKRRRHGEGSVYKRASDGKWVGVADLGIRTDATGARKRVRKTIVCTSEREAVRRLRKLIRDAESGVLPDAIRIERWITQWLTSRESDAKIAAKTLYDYRSAVKNHIIPAIGHIRLDRLTPDDIRTLHAAVAEGRSVTTVRKVHSILQRALKDALAEGRIERNVAALVSAPSPARNPHAILSADQAVTLIRSAKDDLRLRCRLICALGLGIRQSEALGLKWSDVTIVGDGGFVTIDGTVQQIPGQGLKEIDKTKTLASTRDVPLFPLAAAALVAWKKASGASDTGFVFHGHKGPHVPEGPRRDHQAWSDALKAAGLPHAPLHGARGSTGTLLQSLGVPDRIIADILGHSQVKTTQAHYLRSDSAQRTAALAGLDSVLDPKPAEVAVIADNSPVKEVRLKLPESIVDRIDDLAADADVTRAAWVTEVLTRAVAEIERRAERP